MVIAQFELVSLDTRYMFFAINFRPDNRRYPADMWHRLISSLLAAVLCALLYGAWLPVQAADLPHHAQRGPSFSDPDTMAPVSEGWHAQQVTYDQQDRDADLVVALGQQSHPIFHSLIEDYARINKLKIAVKQGTCGITAGRLLHKSIDVGAFCCPPGKSDRLPGLEFHSLGISPIALIVHPDNPLSNVTAQQARDIFSGKYTRWTEVDPSFPGHIQALIKPVGRLHCKIRPGHWRLLLKNDDQFSPHLFEVGVIPDMISQVARNPSAIGWEVPLMTQLYRDKGQVKLLTIDNYSPLNLDHLAAGKYPLYRSYSLTTWQAKNRKSEEAMKLVRFLQQHIEKVHKTITYLPPSRLKQAGWKFRGDELVGEPD